MRSRVLLLMLRPTLRSMRSITSIASSHLVRWVAEVAGRGGGGQRARRGAAMCFHSSLRRLCSRAAAAAPQGRDRSDEGMKEASVQRGEREKEKEGRER